MLCSHLGDVLAALFCLLVQVMDSFKSRKDIRNERDRARYAAMSVERKNALLASRRRPRCSVLPTCARPAPLLPLFGLDLPSPLFEPGASLEEGTNVVSVFGGSVDHVEAFPRAPIIISPIIALSSQFCLPQPSASSVHSRDVVRLNTRNGK